MKNLTLKIGWLYPQLMNIYGDIGNIVALTKRCQWRNINTDLEMLDVGFDEKKLIDCDIIVMGGAQDKEQTLVNVDLKRIKNTLKKKIEDWTPGLYVCGGFQFLGKYYKEADGKIVEGIGLFDLYTENPGENVKRLIGNIVFAPYVNGLDKPIVGFENHGGRTYLGKKVKPFGKVLVGFGNNGNDGTEGAVYKMSFGTYSHGPILPKNPHFTDFLIKTGLKNKYKKEIKLEKLDNSLEENGRVTIAKRLRVEI